MILLTALTAALVLTFFSVLAYGLVKISATLESIGGTPVSYLAKLRLGLRAIEKETSPLAPQVTRINAGLTQIADGLMSIDRHLLCTIDAVTKQEV